MKKTGWIGVGLLAGAVAVLAVLLLRLPHAETGSEPEPAATPAPLSSTILISEYQAGNIAFPNADGLLTDWLELQNVSGGDYDLSGCGLSDSGSQIKFVFPAGTVLPKDGYLRVDCASDVSGARTAPFGISKEGGEKLRFYTADGAEADVVKTIALEKGKSAVRAENGWIVCDRPTPGFANTDAGFAAMLAARGTPDDSVVFSEAQAANRATLAGEDSDFPDWLELSNTGNDPVSLTGWWLSQNEADPFGWRFPETEIAPGEYLLVFCDGKDTGLHTNFCLSSEFGETLLLTSPVGDTVSTVHFGPMNKDESAVWSNGAPEAEIRDEASPGFANTREGALASRIDCDIGSGLVINEVMTCNQRYLQQADDEYYDWVELCNRADTAVNLRDYALTDSLSDPLCTPLPDRMLEPGETCLVICSGNAALSSEAQMHAAFSLNAQDDRLFLLRADGTAADFCRLRGLTRGGSYGRMPEERGYFYFATPTPGAENTGGLRSVALSPAADTNQGIYENVETLQVALRGSGTIYYTLTGATPTEKSEVYTEPLELTQTTVVRAICINEGELPSEVATFSYIINEGHTLPVVSVAADPNNFLSSGGLYYRNERSDYELPASAALFETDGSGFTLDCGVKLHGASSRKYYIKKSLKLCFRPRYAGALDYDVFGNGDGTTYDALILRAGTISSGYILRDPVCCAVAEQCTDKLFILQNRYCVLYLNGQYWGIYQLRDAYSEKFFADRMGVDEDGITIARPPVDKWHQEDLATLFLDVEARGAATEERYDYVASQLDIDGLADWMILQAFFYNIDIPGNIRYARSDTDGIWRYAFFDLDLALLNSAAGWANVFDTANQCGIMPLKLTKNPVFLDKLLTRMAELFSGPLTEEATSEVLEAYIAQLEPEAAREHERWAFGQSWEDMCESMRTCVNSNRREQCVRNLMNTLYLTPEDLAPYGLDIYLHD